MAAGQTLPVALDENGLPLTPEMVESGKHKVMYSKRQTKPKNEASEQTNTAKENLNPQSGKGVEKVVIQKGQYSSQIFGNDDSQDPSPISPAAAPSQGSKPEVSKKGKKSKKNRSSTGKPAKSGGWSATDAYQSGPTQANKVGWDDSWNNSWDGWQDHGWTNSWDASPSTAAYYGDSARPAKHNPKSAAPGWNVYVKEGVKTTKSAPREASTSQARSQSTSSSIPRPNQDKDYSKDTSSYYGDSKQRPGRPEASKTKAPEASPASAGTAGR